MSIGKIWPSEIIEFEDYDTRAKVRQLTQYRAHSHHFYFTNTGWYANGDKLLISSDRNNATNLYGLEIKTGELKQLTDLKPLPLPREVEFLRACVNPTKDESYFLYGLDMIALNLTTLESRVIFTLEEGWDISAINCAADGTHVYASISEDMSDKFRVDYLRGYVGFRETWAAMPLSKIVEVSTDGSGGQYIFEEKYWIGHVNTSPTNPNILTFCHEGPWAEVDNRIWGFDIQKRQAWKIRSPEKGENVGHEYWHADGERVGYHGNNADNTKFLGHCKYDDTDHIENSFPGITGHIHSNDPNLIVGDGSSGKNSDGVVRLWQWNGELYEGPRILCRHDSSAKIQQLHVHPRFSSDGKQVVFTTDVSGYGNVYLVDVPEFGYLPNVEE